jgi:hypothetical protein
VVSAVAAAALLGAAWACSSPDRPPVLPNLPSKDAGDKPDVVIVSSCAVEDGGCNQLQNCGAKVYVVEVAATAPAAVGGTVVDGTYVLTDYKMYTGPSGTSGPTTGWFRQTMGISTGDAGAPADAAAADGGPTQQMDWQGVLEISSAPAVKNTTGRISFHAQSPFQTTIDFSCPGSAGTYTSLYSATSDQLILYGDGATGKAAITYQRQ